MIDPVGGHRGMHYYDFALCDALRNYGQDVLLWTCDETARYAVPSGLTVHFPFVGIFGDRPAIARGIRYAAAQSRILAAAARERPALVHLHYFILTPADLWFLVRLRLLGIKVILTVHDVIPFNAATHTRLMLRALYQRVDGFIVHTEHSRRELLQCFPIDPDRVAVIPHGHYLPYLAAELPSQDAARQQFGLETGSPVILFFGQIKQVKGLDTLLSALPRVLAAHPDATLLIAGQVWKDNWDTYAALIRELDIGNRVRARIEHIPDEDVPVYYRAADVVVLPYRQIYQSGVLLMAYSYSRPVVASNLGGLAETVREGETGRLVPPDDPAALASALNAMLNDQTRALAMGRAGH